MSSAVMPESSEPTVSLPAPVFVSVPVPSIAVTVRSVRVPTFGAAPPVKAIFATVSSVSRPSVAPFSHLFIRYAVTLRRSASDNRRL